MLRLNTCTLDNYRIILFYRVGSVSSDLNNELKYMLVASLPPGLYIGDEDQLSWIRPP